VQSNHVDLAVRLTRLNPTHHCFEAVRTDGSREVRELETRSCLMHDLVHFALESEAKLECGFYGALARAVAYDAQSASGEAMQVENVVASLQTAIKGEVDPAAFVARLRTARASMGETTPEWLTEALIVRVLERLRQLNGRWRATPFGETMELRFDV
jgi:hypothetical protein